MKVIIAENDTVSRDQLCALLKRIGHEVVVVNDGIELLKQMDKDTGVVVTEIELPQPTNLTGVDIVKIVDTLNIGIPVIATTALSPDEIPPSPFIRVLSKPIVVHDILHTLIQLSCPHCSSALRIKDQTNNRFICPHCNASCTVQVDKDI